jgi:hypothetical protein
MAAAAGANVEAAQAAVGAAESGYHQQARAENTFFRYKRMLGDHLHARDGDAQVVEARLACNILNRMTELGMPASYAVRL